jgi:hypothetical protein
MIKRFLMWYDRLPTRDYVIFNIVYGTCCLTLFIAFNAAGKVLW